MDDARVQAPLRHPTSVMAAMRDSMEPAGATSWLRPTPIPRLGQQCPPTGSSASIPDVNNAVRRVVRFGQTPRQLRAAGMGAKPSILTICANVSFRGFASRKRTVANPPVSCQIRMIPSGWRIWASLMCRAGLPIRHPLRSSGCRISPNPDDPFGMADSGFAHVPRGLGDTTSASIERMSYQTLQSAYQASDVHRHDGRSWPRSDTGRPSASVTTCRLPPNRHPPRRKAPYCLLQPMQMPRMS